MKKSVIYRAALAAFGSTMFVGSAMAAPSAWWAPYTTDANTIGLWHFNDVTGSTGTFADSSGNGNTGTLNGNAGAAGSGVTLTVPVTSGAGTGPGAGTFGTALKYQASVAEGSLPGGDTATPYAWGSVPGTNLTYSNAVTIEAWIKPSTDDFRAESDILGTENGTSGWNLGLGGGKLYMDNIHNGYHDAEQSAVTLTAGTWAHVAGVWTNDGTNSTITLYINGAQVGTTSYADGTLASIDSTPLQFGDRNPDQKYVRFVGQMDEVRLSNVAREFGAAPVPEPASLSLLALGGLALLRRRRSVA